MVRFPISAKVWEGTLITKQRLFEDQLLLEEMQHINIQQEVADNLAVYVVNLLP